MLYPKQKSNPRSPLSVLRNQISTNTRSTSRPISRSPSFSPVSRISKPSKDYSLYIPVRSSSRIENAKPKTITSTHLELKSKRKLLVKETQKLEEKMIEIKKKIETEVKINQVRMKKPPRSHCLVFLDKIIKIVALCNMESLTFAFKIVQQAYKNDSKRIEDLMKKSKMKNLKKFFRYLKTFTQIKKNNREKLMEIAKQHFNLQVLFNCFNLWQDFIVIEKMDSQDKSCIEDIDSLLDSFINDSVISIN